MKIISNKNLDKLTDTILYTLEHSIEELLQNKDKIAIGISGGNGVKGILEKMKTSNSIPWNQIHFFMVDERCVEINHQDSNYKQANNILFKDLVKRDLISKSNLHPYHYNEEQEDFGASIYTQELMKISDQLDIIILGMGPDGHIASLFPKHKSIQNDGEFFIPVQNSPKPPLCRISASKKLLQQATTSLLIFFGDSKKEAFSNLEDTSLSKYKCPAHIVRDISNSYLFTDIEE